MDKVLIINGGYYPAKNYGGPVVSIDNICTLLQDRFDFYILCTNHELGDTKHLKGIKEGWNNRANCQVQYLSNEEICEKKLDQIVNEISPSLIYINSLFDAIWTIPLLKIALKRNIHVLLAPRGQICEGAFSKKYKKIPYIWYLRLKGYLKNIHYQATSNEEVSCIKKYLKAPDENISFLTNLPSVPNGEVAFPQKESGKARFVFFSRITRKKNLHKAISFFRDMKGDISFDIYGPIESKEYWTDCENSIECLPDNVKVTYCGIIEHDQVFQILSQYDAFLFPTVSENFGHVISEALFAGCPVIISDTTPWRGLQKTNAGWDISLNDDESFIRAIRCIVLSDNDEEKKRRESARAFADQFFSLDSLKADYSRAFSYNTSRF